jgi:cellulose synthase/poly-beta-1,6-N-acetylglucosamine synthase-like glycosyltransferase
MGIMAHDEEANIGRLLEAVVAQRTVAAEVTEIIVVASGCTDRTEDIVRSWAARDARVRLISQRRREGKAAAVNLFLAHAREEICILCSADLLPAPDTIEQVVAPFAAADLTMTTGRPVPLNDARPFMGFAAHLLWDLHHRINQRSFKAGELIAFRKLFSEIPRLTAVDEASIESVLRGRGHSVRYVADAVTYNRGPATAREFVRQRRRIHAGHLALRNAVGYRVSTLSASRILGLVMRHLDWRPRQFVWTWSVAALEAYGRLLGRIDYVLRFDHSAWAVARTTKMLGPVAGTIESPAPVEDAIE